VGLDVGPDIMQAVARLASSEQLNARAHRILVLDSQKRDATADLARQFGAVQGNVTFKSLSERPVWGERKRNDPNNIVVPTLSLRAIVDWMNEPVA